MLNKTLVFPVALEPRFKVVERILKIRFEGARIRHRVWSPGARGLLDGEGMNRKAVRGCKKIW